MKKKVIKKKVVSKKETTTPSNDVDMPMARMDDDDDVAEDYKVIDMSDIAAPVIEFELPNLGERKVDEVKETAEEKEEDVVEKVAKMKVTPKKKTKKEVEKKQGNKAPLTAEKLNNELVRMRAVVVKGRARLMGKLVRQKKQLESKQGGEGKKKEEVQRKVARLGEEIVGLKTIDKDTVAKFAALNTKTLEELKIDGNTTVAERLMYKLACQDVVVEAVNSYREKYIEWNKTAAFFMQRLGLQYSNKSDKKKKTEETEEKKVSKEQEDSEQVSGAESVEDTDKDDNEEDEEEVTEETGEGDDGDYNESDVEMVDSDEEAGAEAAQKRRNLLLGLIGVSEDKSRPALNPKKRKIEDADDDLILKKTKAKEAVKSEMKQVLEKELKTKEVNNPKQAKQTKKPTAPKTKATPAAKPKESKEEEPIEDDSEQKTLVMKVDLSKGGKITSSKTKTPAPKNQVAISVTESNESDDESNTFFLPKTSSASKKATVTPKKMTVAAKKGKAAVPKEKPEPEPIIEKKKGSSKNKVTSGEVHPSWAASQQKKKEMQAAKPCGKKITFGDDDD